MTLNDRHIKISSFTPSPALTALKKISKVVGIVLATIIGLLLWAIVKPIFRGVGRKTPDSDNQITNKHF